MKKLAMLLTMLPLAVLADIAGPLEMRDLDVTARLVVYWLVLAFATGLSIVLGRKPKSCVLMLMIAAIPFWYLGFGVAVIMPIGEPGALVFQYSIPVAVAMFSVYALINKVYCVRWKKGLMFIPLIVMTVWCLFGFRLLFAECRTCGSKGVIRWYDMGHQCAECNCCKGRCCHFRWGCVGCVEDSVSGGRVPRCTEQHGNDAAFSNAKKFTDADDPRIIDPSVP